MSYGASGGWDNPGATARSYDFNERTIDGATFEGFMNEYYRDYEMHDRTGGQ
jgi:hypothetical protein